VNKAKARFLSWVALFFSIGIIAGSFLWPWLGLAVPLLAVGAGIGALFRPKWFCSKACPRGRILGYFLKPLARFRPTPGFLSSPRLRSLFCGVILFSSLGQLTRLWPHFESLGWFFWGVCVATLGLALGLGLLYKPRSWCVVCPLGTFQETLAALVPQGGKKP
jgi:hypothetical protein